MFSSVGRTFTVDQRSPQCPQSHRRPIGSDPPVDWIAGMVEHGDVHIRRRPLDVSHGVGWKTLELSGGPEKGARHPKKVRLGPGPRASVGLETCGSQCSKQHD